MRKLMCFLFLFAFGLVGNTFGYAIPDVAKIENHLILNQSNSIEKIFEEKIAVKFWCNSLNKAIIYRNYNPILKSEKYSAFNRKKNKLLHKA